jgi:hypothetical protein
MYPRSTSLSFLRKVARQKVVLRWKVRFCNCSRPRKRLITNRGDADKCYVDQGSVCDEDSAVACTVLANGTEKACCPKLTTCEVSIPASESLVRCNINRGDLLVADAGQNGKSSTTDVSSTIEASSTSAEAASSTTIDPESQTTSSTSHSDDKSRPIAGGIVVAAVVGAAGIAGLVFWLLRRMRKKYEAANQSPPQLTIPQYYQDQQMKYQQQQQGYYHMGDQYGGYTYSGTLHGQQQMQPQPPAELMDQRPPVELDRRHGASS